MRKLLIAGMMGAAAMIGCGDDEPGEDTSTNGNTEGDGGTGGDQDGGGEPVYETQVENAGAACTGDGDCTGMSASCLTVVEVPDTSGLGGLGGGGDTDGGSDMDAGADAGAEIPEIPYPGGYCSATCTDSAECGEGGGCIGASLLNTIQSFVGDQVDLSGFLMLNCGETCVEATDCREGYICGTALEALAGAGGQGGGGLGGFDLSAIAGSLPTYCLPEPPEMEEDAGTDGGDTDGGDTDGGDTDGGDTDGGDTDGGDTDGGTDAGTDAG